MTGICLILFNCVKKQERMSNGIRSLLLSTQIRSPPRPKLIKRLSYFQYLCICKIVNTLQNKFITQQVCVGYALSNHTIIQLLKYIVDFRFRIVRHDLHFIHFAGDKNQCSTTERMNVHLNQK